jgi:hypothetical protein
MTHKHLTPRERDVATAIRDYTNANGRPPAMVDILVLLDGMRNTKTLRHHLDNLTSKKMIHRRRRYAVRDIRLTPQALKVLAA